MDIGMRIERIERRLAEGGLDALILSRYQTIGYITGVFQRWGTLALVPVAGVPIVISAERRRVEHEAWAPERLAFRDAQLVGEADHVPKLQVLAQEVRRLGLADGRLGIEKAHLSAGELEELTSFLPGAELVDAGDVVPRLMLIKDATELGALRRVAEIADAAMHEALRTLRVGVSELEVAGLVDLALRRAGGERTWFPTHVCSGRRADFDMAYPTEKLIQFHDRVAVDIGPTYHLYCGQLNSHVVVGKASAEDKSLFQGVADVHRKVFDTLRVGIRASEVHRIALDYAHRLGWAGCLGYFGRGIGIIDNEELLVFSASCHTELMPGMVMATVTYIRDGHRTISTERMVALGVNGPEWLSTYPLELVEV